MEEKGKIQFKVCECAQVLIIYLLVKQMSVLFVLCVFEFLVLSKNIFGFSPVFSHDNSHYIIS